MGRNGHRNCWALCVDSSFPAPPCAATAARGRARHGGGSAWVGRAFCVPSGWRGSGGSSGNWQGCGRRERDRGLSGLWARRAGRGRRPRGGRRIDALTSPAGGARPTAGARGLGCGSGERTPAPRRAPAAAARPQSAGWRAAAWPRDKESEAGRARAFWVGRGMEGAGCNGAGRRAGRGRCGRRARWRIPRAAAAPRRRAPAAGAVGVRGLPATRAPVSLGPCHAGCDGQGKGFGCSGWVLLCSWESGAL
jgi:hypothetical protein